MSQLTYFDAVDYISSVKVSKDRQQHFIGEVVHTRGTGDLLSKPSSDIHSSCKQIGFETSVHCTLSAFQRRAARLKNRAADNGFGVTLHAPAKLAI